LSEEAAARCSSVAEGKREGSHGLFLENEGGGEGEEELSLSLTALVSFSQKGKKNLCALGEKKAILIRRSTRRGGKGREPRSPLHFREEGITGEKKGGRNALPSQKKKKGKDAR